jgi:predicted TIM-barrel fold metal-dependent hydrolase
MKLARRLGFERFVFEQPSAYGFDNFCMLDAMAEVAPELRRGIVQFDETKPSDAVLGKWHAQGVRGVRINVSPVRKPEAGFADHLVPKIVRTAAICRELGWHLDFLLPGWLISELMAKVPDQLIWGSDFPHLSFHDKVGTIQLYNLLGEWAPDAAMRKRILVDNPARLFGFA